jgi:hypothetical protein
VQCGLVGVNDCKCNRDQHLNVTKHVKPLYEPDELEIVNFGHPSDDRPLLTLPSLHDRKPPDYRAPRHVHANIYEKVC